MSIWVLFNYGLFLRRKTVTVALLMTHHYCLVNAPFNNTSLSLFSLSLLAEVVWDCDLEMPS